MGGREAGKSEEGRGTIREEEINRGRDFTTYICEGGREGGREGRREGGREREIKYLLSVFLGVKRDVPAVILGKFTRGVVGTEITTEEALDLLQSVCACVYH